MEFSILILSVAFKMLADSYIFPIQVGEIFLREVRSEAFGLKYSQDFIPSHKTDSRHTI